MYMSANYISLQEAASLAGKSVQTIRRAIKAKKLLAKRKKTPQGFNYLVDKESLVETFKLEGKVMQEAVEQTVPSTEISEKVSDATVQAIQTIEQQYTEVKDLFSTFNKTMQTLVEHNNQERDNFYRLMKTFQDRVVMLEDNVRVMSEKANKKWFKFWS